jgi:hypothetical protein
LDRISKNITQEVNKPLTVREQMHGFWKMITITFGILCAIFFLIFWNLTDPFWTGIVRLGSFIFFAITVLGCLKLMSGPLQITLSSTDELLLVSYQKKGEIIQEEQFDRDSINEVRPINPSGNLIQYLQPNSKAFKINFTDSERDLYLFEFGGRPLLFGAPSQQKIAHYLQQLEIDII